MKAYIESFLPLFVAVNVLGILPMYLGLTETMNAAERRRLTLLAVATATVIAVLILFAGQLVFSLLGITVNDLRVGGGLILLVLSISNLIFGDYRRRDPRQGEEEPVEDVSEMGVVPLGIPLIKGPAAITSILVSRDHRKMVECLNLDADKRGRYLEILDRNAVSLEEALGRPLSWSDLADGFEKRLAAALGIDAAYAGLTPEETARAEDLAQEKAGAGLARLVCD